MGLGSSPAGAPDSDSKHTAALAFSCGGGYRGGVHKTLGDKRLWTRL